MAVVKNSHGSLQKWTLFLMLLPTVSSVSITLMNGPLACPGQVRFVCNVSSPLLAWSSTEYIGQRGVRIEFTSIDGEGSVKRMMGTNATLLRVNGTTVLSSELRVTAIAGTAASVTCEDNDGIQDTFSFQVPGVLRAPRRVEAVETSESREGNCIILVTWAPPVDTDESELKRYIVEIPSQNISMSVGNNVSSTLLTLRVPNCRAGVLVQVFAVNHCGFHGLSTAAQAQLLPTAENAATPTSSTPSSSTSSSNVLEIAISVPLVVMALLTVLFFVVVIFLIIYIRHKLDFSVKKEKKKGSEDAQVLMSVIEKTDGVQQSEVEPEMELLNSQTMEKVTQLEREMREIREEHEKQVTQLEREMRETQEEHEKQVTQLEREMRETQEEHEKQVTQLKQVTALKSDLEALKQQQTKTMDQVTQLKREMRETQKEHEKQVTQLKHEMRETKEEEVTQINSQLSSKLKELEARIKQQQTKTMEQVTQLNSQLSSERKKLEVLKQQQSMVSDYHDLRELYKALISKSRPSIRTSARNLLKKLTKDPPQINDDVIKEALINFLKESNDDVDMMNALDTLKKLVSFQPIHDSMEKMVTRLAHGVGTENGFDDVVEVIKRELPTNIKDILKRLCDQLKQVPDSSRDALPEFMPSGRRGSSSMHQVHGPIITLSSQAGSDARPPSKQAAN